VREAVGLTGFSESDDEPIRIDDADAPPMEEPPDEPVAAGKPKGGAGRQA
jgi:hypothetical protein